MRAGRRTDRRDELRDGALVPASFDRFDESQAVGGG